VAESVVGGRARSASWFGATKVVTLNVTTQVHLRVGLTCERDPFVPFCRSGFKRNRLLGIIQDRHEALSFIETGWRVSAIALQPK
jgi:hypothetical protein